MGDVVCVVVMSISMCSTVEVGVVIVNKAALGCDVTGGRWLSNGNCVI